MTAVALQHPPDWTERAACKGKVNGKYDPWHPADDTAPGEQARMFALARLVCLGCPVQVECTRYGVLLLETEGVDGMYGGMTPDQLRALARRLARSSRKVAQHGTRACYVKGCRRPECRAANARDEAERRLRVS